MKRHRQYAADKRIIQLFGLRRSGNHAVLSWIMSSLEGRVLHLNEVTCARPYQCFWRARAKGFSRWELHRKCCKVAGCAGVNRYLLAGVLGRGTGIHSVTNKDLDPGVARAEKDALILSYEDWELDHPKLPRLLRPTERGDARGSSTSRVLLLRDPFNLFASLLRSERMTETNSTYYVRAWKQYAREYLGETSYLGNQAVLVSYKEWRDSPEARVRICRQLQLPENEAPFTEVSKTGGGSSFDGVAKDARRMKTGERWKQFSEDDFYRGLFDEELRNLSARIFGSPPF